MIFDETKGRYINTFYINSGNNMFYRLVLVEVHIFTFIFRLGVCRVVHSLVVLAWLVWVDGDEMTWDF